MDANEFELDRQIDPDQLDVEAVRQADVFFKWAERAIKAKSETDRAKFRLDVVEARLSLECREKPENFGLARVTEAAVGTAVKASKRYEKAHKAYLDAREASAMLDKAVEAMEQRKRMIEVLITLHGQQYFAGPSVPRNLPEAYRTYRDSITERTDEKMRKRVRKRGSKKMRKKVRRRSE